MSAMVSIEKTVFKPGETIQVRIDIDNSNCKKDVKSFKTKLVRKVQFFGGKEQGPGVVSKPIIDDKEIIVALKHPGIPAHSNEIKTVELQIPMEDKDIGSTAGMHRDLQMMTTMFSETVHNQMFKVEYHLEVYVKHQSKLEFGKGNAVDFPIIIRNQN